MTDLRKAAKAATPGPWKTHLIDDTTIVSDRVDVATTCDSSNVERSDSYNNDFERMEADAAYIAAANPQAILALLDERDALTARVAALEAENEKLREALAPSADTKAAYIGEFSFDHEIYDLEKDCPISIRIIVPWTTTKEIMAAILRRAEAARGEE